MKKINLIKVTPQSTGIITTADRFTTEESKHNGIIDSTKEGQLKDIQKVVFVSRFAKERGIEVDDIVSLDFKRYAQMSQKKDSLKEGMDEHYNSVLKYNIPILLIEKKEHLKLDIADIDLKIDEFEYYTEGEGFLTGEKDVQIIKPSGLIIN